MKNHTIRVWFLAILVIFPLSALLGQQKYALIIGNSAYTSISPLKNPVNDARDMQAALQRLGFQVDILTNGGLEQMERAVSRFKNRLSLSKDAYGFFFYAGHGVHSNGENYLIPVDGVIASESALRLRAVSVQVILDEIHEAGNVLNIMVLDACRDNPFSWGRNGMRGLQEVSSQPADSIIVYAASAGGVTSDGEGRNGLFTAYLLKHLKTPGLEFREVFRRTGEDVQKASGDAQRPGLYDQSDLLVCLVPESAPQVQPVNPAQDQTPLDKELADYYEAELFQWNYDFWGGLTLQYRDQSSGIFFGLKEPMRQAFTLYDDTYQQYLAYHRKIVLSNAFWWSGYAAVLSSPFIILSGLETQQENSRLYNDDRDLFWMSLCISAGVLCGGLVLGLIGELVQQSGLKHLFTAVNTYNRYRIRDYQQNR